ncbi:MAG: hypothetical protein RL226_55 [Bacteroidota bacterium]
MESYVPTGSVMTILPLVTFGNLRWFATLLQSGCIIDIGEHYQKQTWRNRFDICGPNGLFQCTLTVKGQKGEKIAVKDIELIQDGWNRRFLRTLATSYGPSPYYIHYESELSELFLADYASLSAFNDAALRWALKAIGSDFVPTFSSDFIDASPEDQDLRGMFKPSKSSESSPAYPQVFEDRNGFISNLSVLDLIMNLGPESYGYLMRYPLK